MRPYTLLVVLYKQRIQESKTITSFAENCPHYHTRLNLVIWDNSPDNINADTSYLNNYNVKYSYQHTPQNKPLSYIYNNILITYKDSEFIFLFDQDSIITEEYFDKSIKALSLNPNIALSIPYVMHNNTIVSPGKFQFYKGHYLKNITFGINRSKNIIAITSGMAIKSSSINNKNLKFDENLSLYGIDTKFCLDYSTLFNEIFIIKYQLKHSLSQFESEDKRTKIYRYKSQMKAMRYITKKRSFLAYILCWGATCIHYTMLRIKLS